MRIGFPPQIFGHVRCSAASPPSHDSLRGLNFSRHDFGLEVEIPPHVPVRRCLTSRVGGLHYGYSCVYVVEG